MTDPPEPRRRTVIVLESQLPTAAPHLATLGLVDLVVLPDAESWRMIGVLEGKQLRATLGPEDADTLGDVLRHLETVDADALAKIRMLCILALPNVNPNHTTVEMVEALIDDRATLATTLEKLTGLRGVKR